MRYRGHHCTQLGLGVVSPVGRDGRPPTLIRVRVRVRARVRASVRERESQNHELLAPRPLSTGCAYSPQLSIGEKISQHITNSAFKFQGIHVRIPPNPIAAKITVKEMVESMLKAI